MTSDRSAAPSGSVIADAVRVGAEDVQRDVRLIAHHPAVVSSWDREEVTRPHHELVAVVHADGGAAGDDEPDVLDLARRRADRPADVLGPPPSRLVPCPPTVVPPSVTTSNEASSKVLVSSGSSDRLIESSIAPAWQKPRGSAS